MSFWDGKEYESPYSFPDSELGLEAARWQQLHQLMKLTMPSYYGPPGASVTTTILRQMQKDKAIRGHPFLRMG